MILKKTTLHNSPMTLNQGSFVIDIETTGFSARYAAIYLMGIAYEDDGKYIVEQWFCEKESDEYELLFRFNRLLEDNPTLYHYNGDGFDLPFIKKRMALFGISCNAYQSVDLLKLVRPFKKSLGMEDLKLKTVEAFFGYDRVDPYNGGDLIEVYQTYLNTQDEHLKDTLLLHNYEDLVGLLDVLSHIPLFRLLEDFHRESVPIKLDYSTLENGHYEAHFKIDLYTDVTLSHHPYTLSLKHGTAVFKVPVNVDEMYYFFPDYKNYIYLINEGYAVHKSIGRFVAKEHRANATKETAYVKKEGFFLPASKRYGLPVPLYYRDSVQKNAFVSVEDLFGIDGFAVYIGALLSEI